MSEIKGQLLGIILTLMVFGAVSGIVAHLYKQTANKVTNYGETIDEPAADEVGFDINSSGAIRLPTNAAFPGLHY